MPRVDDEAAKAIAHIYPDSLSAEKDIEEGGTGFVIAVPMRDVQPYVIDHLYVATNRHLVVNRQEPAVVLLRRDGRRVPIGIPAESWFDHPMGLDDVVVAPLQGIDLAEYDLAAFPATHCIQKEQVETLEVGLGVDVFYLGRFMPRENGPSITTVRFGSVSSMPVQVEHPRFKVDVESYLVDCRSRAGFSGSPVVAMLRGPIVQKDHPRSAIHLGADTFLLGISWGHMSEWQKAHLAGHKADLLVDLNAGILCVTPAWRIFDILQRDELVAKRDADRVSWAAEHGRDA